MAKPRTPLPAVGIAALLPGLAVGRAGGIFPSGSSAGDDTFWAALGVLVLATGLILGFIGFNRRREGRSGVGTAAEVSGAEGPSLRELDAEAAQILSETDEAVKTGERELDAAITRYGPDGAAYATRTLTEAKGHLAEALRLRGRLEAESAPAEDELRQILRQVIHRCGEANAALDLHFAALEQMREQ